MHLEVCRSTHGPILEVFICEHGFSFSLMLFFLMFLDICLCASITFHPGCFRTWVLSQVEMHRLLDEKRVILDTKMQEFELDMEDKRKALERELSDKVDAIRNKESEISHRYEKLGKREQALHEKSERLKDKKQEYEEKLIIAKEREKVIKVEEKKLELEKQQVFADREHLQSLKDEVERIKAENIQLGLLIREKGEKQRITDKERSEHSHLQLELKLEIENYRHKNEMISMEAEDLKQQKEKLEKEWEDLNVKRSEISREFKEIVKEKENFEKLQHFEEDRLKRDRYVVNDYIKRELENLKLEKESFTVQMKDEQSGLSEKAQLEHGEMVRDFELRRRDLKSEMQNRQEEMEKILHKTRIAFENDRDKELNNINYLKEVAHNDMEEARSKRNRIEEERDEVALNKEKLKLNQLEIQKDIQQLDLLSKMIKNQREGLLKERGHFVACVEKIKSCKDCGEIARELVLSDFQVPELNHGNDVPLLRLNDELLGKSPGDLVVSDSGGHMSWLRKCTSKILKLSPINEFWHVTSPEFVESLPLSTVQVDNGRKGKGHRLWLHEDEPQTSFEVANSSVNVQQLRSDNITREIDDVYVPSVDDHNYINSKMQDFPENSAQSDLKSGHRTPGKRTKSELHRTCSVTAVVEDAKAFLGETPEELLSNPILLPNDHGQLNQESQDDLSLAEKSYSKTARKRQHPEMSQITESVQDVCDSEGCSGRVAVGGRRKRQQKAATALQTSLVDRYNFRPRRK